MSTDYDSPWKEALDAYFEPFLALLFPEVHRRIDWSRGYESLDKEFQQVVREAEVGRRYVDKLVKVWTTGAPSAGCWSTSKCRRRATQSSVRFGEEGLRLMPEIQEIYEEEKLQAILIALEKAASPDEVRRLWAPD